MSVLDRAALEDSPLADLHALATELGIDGFRRLRKAELIDAIITQQGGDPGEAPAPAPASAPAPARKPRARSRAKAEPAAEAEPAEEEETGPAESATDEDSEDREERPRRS